MSLPVKKEFPYEKIHSFKDGNPYSVTFVYSKDESFILKGGIIDVKKYLKKNFIKPCIVHHTMFRHGRHRRYISFENFKGYDVYASKAYDYDTYKSLNYYELYARPNKKYNHIELKRFKRIPRKWIKELDLLVDI